MISQKKIFFVWICHRSFYFNKRMSNNECNIFCCVGRGGGNDLNISLSGERIIVEYKEYSGQKNLFNYLVNQSPPPYSPLLLVKSPEEENDVPLSWCQQTKQTVRHTQSWSCFFGGFTSSSSSQWKVHFYAKEKGNFVVWWFPPLLLALSPCALFVSQQKEMLL